MIESMEKKRIRFDATRHAYFLVGPMGEVQVPSVTDILKRIGMINAGYFRDTDRERGVLIHALTRWVERFPQIRENLGDFVLDMLLEFRDRMDPGDLYGWVSAWAKFLQEAEWESETVEKVRVHSSELFAGRVDRTGYIRNPKVAKKNYLDPEDLVVLDIKTGGFQDWHMLQLEAYRAMVREENPEKTVRKVGLYLRPNGRYSLRNFVGEIESTWMKAVYAYYELVVPIVKGRE